MSSDQPGPDSAPEAVAVAAAPERPSRRRTGLIALFVGLLVLDAIAFLVVPPFDPNAQGSACAFPVCFINGNLEFPAPAVVFDPNPSSAPPPGQIVFFDVTITSTLLTMWIVGGLVLIAGAVLGRLRSPVPGRIQNASEWVYETISNFGISIGGRRAIPYIPIFAAYFLLILACNWAGLVPPVGKVEFLRAPTSDVNVTIGLALVSFVIFESQGFIHLGVRGYLGKFFPFYEFRNGVGAGLIAMFVGLIELMLEFVKPLTLSMRLFGNIYGGEVALGVITSLTLFLVPVLLYLLEGMLNLIQALIFSVLTLMFILSAIESHHEEEGEIAEEMLGHDAEGAAGTAPA